MQSHSGSAHGTSRHSPPSPVDVTISDSNSGKNYEAHQHRTCHHPALQYLANYPDENPLDPDNLSLYGLFMPHAISCPCTLMVNAVDFIMFALRPPI